MFVWNFKRSVFTFNCYVRKVLRYDLKCNVVLRNTGCRLPRRIEPLTLLGTILNRFQFTASDNQMLHHTVKRTWQLQQINTLFHTFLTLLLLFEFGKVKRRSLPLTLETVLPHSNVVRGLKLPELSSVGNASWGDFLSFVLWHKMCQ